ncbi:hypothetical protein SAMN05518668_11621 [Sphingobium sp. YR657]|uniref:nucleotidyltransferase domain-containing protein n=1 Tax=Sphingobium sp. YR657 TaxID=1884366 RepID=UPI00090EF772|nr:nucleotidyltransferase domain-containing protein [Sphingobium sp. YR657]SHM66415.1 hypothetical protein SAMN05518668_11621 [Sphingobium sp. YR657]
MGISFDRETRIAGYRPSSFKDGLKAYLRTLDPGNFIDLRSIFPLRRDGAIVFEECIDRGLIDPQTHKVTEKGMVVARAKVVPRTSLAKARAVLDRFLDNVDALNADTEALTGVSEVWLFGSLMRGEPTVGDIDLAIGRSNRGDFKDADARIAQAKKQLEAYPDAPQSWDFPWERISWLHRRRIFGPRRDKLLAGAQEGMEDLASLGVPCQLIHDRARGGRVDDPVLPLHPTSSGRSNDIDPMPEMPDLSPAPLRPMDARWVSRHYSGGEVLAYEIFRGWTDDCRALLPHTPNQLRIVTNATDFSHFQWAPRALGKQQLDGRSAVALLSATEQWGTCVTLHRAFEGPLEALRLDVHFSDLLLHRSRRYVDAITLPDLAGATALILAVDAERALRRQVETTLPAQMTIRIAEGDLPDDMINYFLEEVISHLEQRKVSIEPQGMAAKVRIERT